MSDKEKRFVFESFEDRKFAIVVGFFCLTYFLLTYLPLGDTAWLARIVPHWKLSVFGCIAAGTFLLQVVVWNLFKHFYSRWYLNPLTLILFVCEFGLILFTILFLSWPVFWFVQFFIRERSGI